VSRQIALIGLLQFQKPKDVSVAQSQLQEVKAAVDSWDSPEARLEKAL
jgi:hypothetical protein